MSNTVNKGPVFEAGAKFISYPVVSPRVDSWSSNLLTKRSQSRTLSITPRGLQQNMFE